MSHALQLLGPFRLRVEGRTRPVAHSVARVLAALALEGAMSRTQIAALLWPDTDTNQGLSNLRTILSRLGRTVPGVVECEGSVVALAETVSVDVDAVMSWVTSTIYGGGGPPAELTGPPAELVRPLLAGWDDPWAAEHRDRLRLLTSQALECAASRLLVLGRPAEALPYGMAAVSVEPWSESANRVLIEIHARRGDPAGALRQYERFSRALERELGVQPAPDIVALIRQLFPFGTGRVSTASRSA
ncbi:AfsR/SARP family transcriptional regulator [Cellulomonas bogoriensis]|uniref:SARP family transcriptional regulator n=1 Tax=Cellulomonas bogoriensis 69B4 = DSM 16987 TaxID=1386082 RepID=A0A0A0BRL2_9CELL|nr:BTAD domain-containing putative transcriptional regulator [Cellulomonas bogoriensis]KGM10600.1 SARP family transcriptional regulator [Cellulomonas bogoriensis 69B4 = DSM 16987]